ncbi:MAG: SPOR domain-containing protein, partial [Burkholderiaceae bacterium]
TGAFAAQQGPAPSAGAQLIQVASLTDIARARDMQRSLRDAGFDAYWESVKSNTGDTVRVRVSVDPATQTVANTIARLKALGYDPVIVTP